MKPENIPPPADPPEANNTQEALDETPCSRCPLCKEPLWFFDCWRSCPKCDLFFPDRVERQGATFERGAILMTEMIWWIKNTNPPPNTEEMTQLIDRAKMWVFDAKLNKEPTTEMERICKCGCGRRLSAMDCDCPELTADQVQLKARILASVSENQKARSEGESAARAGLKPDANPYNGRYDTHWQWLNAWETWKEKHQRP